MKRPLVALLGIVCILGGVAGPAAAADAGLPDEAASLRPQSGEGDELKATFNESVDNVRLMVLLSPT